MRSFALCFLLCLTGCRDTRGGGEDAGTPAECGDGVRGEGEICDGSDLGGQSCGSLGLGGGTLACASDCSSLDASGCDVSCTPDCAGRECGPDPACPISSCGECGPGQGCSAGACVGGDPGAPNIISLTTNTSRVRPSDTLVVTAVVTDPDGIADLIGGTLESPLGGTYGAFTSGGGEGSFSITLTIGQLDSAEAISTPPGGVDRTLRARFYDQGGLEAVRDVTVRIACDDTAQGVCGTSCYDLDTDRYNCGACANQCEVGGGKAQCMSGQCAVLLYGSDADSSCNDTCASFSLRCAPEVGFGPDWAGCEGYPGCGYNDFGEPVGLTCAQAFPSTEVRCLCVE